MKRTILTLILIVIANIGIFAQSNIQFMDIPLNGDFDTFKEKLEMKDIHKDSLGKYGFSGFFFGKIASISIGYNEETNNVYSAFVRYNQSMTNMSEDKMRILYRNIYQGVKKKYPKTSNINIKNKQYYLKF